MMTNDPVVQQQMERMRAAQAEADGYASRAVSATRSRTDPAQGFAGGFLSQFDPSAFKGPGTASNPAQGIKAQAGDGAALASTTGAPGVSASQGQALGLNAQNTPFAQGIGAGIQAGLSGVQPSQMAVDYGIGGQQVKKPTQGEKTW